MSIIDAQPGACMLNNFDGNLACVRNAAITIMPAVYHRLRFVPLFLTLLRAALAPVMVCIALTGASHAVFAICLLTAFLSDIFDGKIARRIGVATPNLRRLDSIADSVFYVAATGCVWILQRDVITGHAAALLALLMLEISRYVVDIAKFRKEASYHMWSSKLWGLFLFLAFFSVLVFGSNGIIVDGAIYLGLLADVEGLVISIILPHWKNDVPSFVHAFRIRKEALSPGRTPRAGI